MFKVRFNIANLGLTVMLNTQYFTLIGKQDYVIVSGQCCCSDVIGRSDHLGYKGLEHAWVLADAFP